MSIHFIKYLHALSVLTGVMVFMLLPLQAQSATLNTGPTSSAVNAVDIAKDGVDASLRDRVVSIYGTGSPAAIQTWWVIFYDPSVPSHGRAVKVENGQVVRSYEAKGGVIYSDTLTFPRTQVTGTESALIVAQDYAAQHALAYDNVRVLLRTTTANPAFRWRIQLLDGKTSRGFVYVNAQDGTFALYSPPDSVPSKDTAASTGGVAGDVQKAGKEVKNTFLGIGGDLQEFFTGERTVDR